VLRVLLTVVLPLFLPLALYIGYLALARRRAQVAGEDLPPFWQQGPWPWLFLAGAVLVFAVLAYWRFHSGLPPETKFRAPYTVDGEIVPSQPIESPPPETPASKYPFPAEMQ